MAKANRLRRSSQFKNETERHTTRHEGLIIHSRPCGLLPRLSERSCYQPIYLLRKYCFVNILSSSLITALHQHRYKRRMFSYQYFFQPFGSTTWQVCTYPKLLRNKLKQTDAHFTAISVAIRPMRLVKNSHKIYCSQSESFIVAKRSYAFVKFVDDIFSRHLGVT